MQSAMIPWGAWRGNKNLSMNFPKNWKLHVASMADVKDISRADIKRAFANPIGHETIRKLAEGKKTAAIAVDDLTRPTQAYRFMPFIIDELKKGGIGEDGIIILMAIGCHRPLMKMDQEKKLGKKVANRFPVINHHPYENIVNVGATSRGTPVQINRHFIEADLKIGVGFITPHPSAGFGGGGKIVIPGLGSIDTIEKNHRPAFMEKIGGTGFSQGYDLNKNELRRDMEEGARMAGLDVIVNSVGTSDGRTAGVFIGDLVKAHRAAVELARKVYITDAPSEVDIGIFNAFPEDTELVQAQKALNVWTGNMNRRIVREGGKVVITTASSDGLGFHSLADPGMRMYRPAAHRKSVAEIFKGRKVLMFSPNCSPSDLYTRYPRSVMIRNKWEDILEELKDGDSGQTVAIFPNGSLQFTPI
ncbi:MAG: nickel-dependent lactate racemase [Deltaproteobacteria bacterium]|nr:nickel-dependent lactate racemase [Deltaproteobacteria bacterium]MBW2308663.1 nickel-dependent lactate racemase [Deltaproteobacteria bacterium]